LTTQPLEPALNLETGRLVLGSPGSNQMTRQPGPGVFGTLSSVVNLQTFFEVVGDAGVKSSVRTPKNIQTPAVLRGRLQF